MKKVTTGNKVRTSERKSLPQVPEIYTISFGSNYTVTLDDREKLDILTKEIREGIGRFEKTFLSSAFALYEISRLKLFKLDGCRNIYDFADKHFRLARGTCNNYINICKKFGQIEEDGTCHSIKDKYTGFSSSQLIALLSYKDDTLRDTLTPEMTVKEIKDKWKTFKESQKVIEGESRDVSATDSAVPEEPTSKIKNSEKHQYANLNGQFVLADSIKSSKEIGTDIKKYITETVADFKGANPQVTPTIKIVMVWEQPVPERSAAEDVIFS